MKSDQEIATEIQELKDERRRVHRGAGPFRSEVHARLSAMLGEARAVVAEKVAIAGHDVPPLHELLELHALRSLVMDEGFEKELRASIDAAPFGDEGAYRKEMAKLDGEISKLEAELRQRHVDRERKRLQEELESLPAP
jgi:hypothetical protein